MKGERVQTGVRMEKRLVKVLKALAELRDLSLGDLLEYIVCRAFEGQEPFATHEVGQIVQLMGIISEGSNVLYGTARSPTAPLDRVTRLAGTLLVQAAQQLR